MTTALEGGERSAARSGRTLRLGKTRYPFYRRPGGPQGRYGRAENLAPTGIRPPNRLARRSIAIPTELPGPHLTQYYSFHQIEKNKVDGACSAYGGEERRIEGLVGKPEGKKPLGRHRHRWEDNIKRDVQ